MKTWWVIGGAALLVWACSATVDDHGSGGSAGATTTSATGGGGDGDDTCPGAPPTEGGACDGEPLSCDYGVPECLTRVTCVDGAWETSRFGDCAAECPTEAPSGGCTTEGLACTYGLGEGCTGTFEVLCTDGSWEVTRSACDFACPDTPEELPNPCDTCCHHPCFYDGPAFCDEWWGTCEADGTWTVTRPIC